MVVPVIESFTNYMLNVYVHISLIFIQTSAQHSTWAKTYSWHDKISVHIELSCPSFYVRNKLMQIVLEKKSTLLMRLEPAPLGFKVQRSKH